MNNETILLIAEDDEGHARLIERNLLRAGIINRIEHFRDGEEILDFLFRRGERVLEKSKAYVLLLDIRMPKYDGVQVLEQIKSDAVLRRIPVIMITTTDDPKEVDRCHDLGCSSYITKPIEYDAFIQCIRQLGFFLAVVKVPTVMREED